MVQLYIH